MPSHSIEWLTSQTFHRMHRQCVEWLSFVFSCLHVTHSMGVVVRCTIIPHRIPYYRNRVFTDGTRRAASKTHPYGTVCTPYGTKLSHLVLKWSCCGSFWDGGSKSAARYSPTSAPWWLMSMGHRLWLARAAHVQKPYPYISKLNIWPFGEQNGNHSWLWSRAF